jgi:alkylation response protein AidB-like acyl-CoA dehydrogenase
MSVAGDVQAIAVARDFADSIDAGAAQRDRAGAAPRASWRGSTPAGCWGSRCRGPTAAPSWPPRPWPRCFRIIAAADPAIAQTPQAHYLFIDAVAFLGTDGQRRRLFDDVLAGRRIGNALAERDTKHAQDLQ